MLYKVYTRKACDPDNIPGCVLKVCANLPAPVFTTIHNLSLSQCIVPTCFKSSTIIPAPKTPCPASLNDYHPVALTSLVMKYFEKLVRAYICSSLPRCLDPLQFAYQSNRSTDYAIHHTLHTALSHLDQRIGKYSTCECCLWITASSLTLSTHIFA